MNGGIFRAYRQQTITIASGATASTSIDLRGFAWGSVGFQGTPASLTGASVTVQVSHDGTTFRDLVTAAGVAVDVIPLKTCGSAPLPDATFQFPYARIVSAGAEGATRTFDVYLSG